MMLFKRSENSQIKKILIVSLTNIGDAVLTCPVIDALIMRFPLAEISIVVGPKAKGLFEGNPYIKKVHIFTKKETWFELLLWVKILRKERFDVVVDLRNTALAYFLGASFHTSVFTKRSPLAHKKHQHFEQLKSVFPDISLSSKRYAIFVNEPLRERAENLFRSFMEQSKSYIVVAAGAADFRKRWTPSGFGQVCRALSEERKVPIFFVGDDNDRSYTDSIIAKLPKGAVNLCGKATLLETAWIVRHSLLAICNDSAIMHVASYFDVPTVGLFGPTDPKKYGPWGERGVFVQTSQLNQNGEGLIDGIGAEDVLTKIKGIL